MIKFSYQFDTSGAQNTLKNAVSLKVIAKAVSLRQDELQKAYQDATPTNVDNRDRFRGRLKVSWISKVVTDSSAYSVALTVDNTDRRTFLLDILKYGSKPHIIRARRKKMLRFPVPVNSGSFRSARFVLHPGTRPVPSLGAPLDSKVTGIIRSMQQDITSLLAANANSPNGGNA